MSKVTLSDAYLGQDRTGDKYDVKTMNMLCAQMINNEWYFTRRGKKMSKDIDKATELVDESVSRLNSSINKMMDVEKHLSDSTRTISTNVRTTTDKLAQGLARIEKQANFNRLETYVELLERAEKALSALAELESKGKLEKIALALK